MKYSFFLGIDMAKLTFDFCILDQQANCLFEGQVKNKPQDIIEWIDSLSKQPIDWSTTLVCLEHAGYYAAPLLRTVHQQVPNADIWLESALQIKRSNGLQRGKNDRIDALRIATYALDFQRKARLWKPISKNIERLGLLLSHRDRLVRSLLSLKNTLVEEKDFIDSEFQQELEDINLPAIQQIEVAIQTTQERIQEILQADVELKRKAEITASIPGFGPVIASKLIQVTHGFTRLTDPKALACFAGVAPFEHTSGTSLKGKTRVSHLANKDIKKMLHLAALVTIRKGNIMHEYFLRKVAEGKNKMSIINAVRNKLIHILLACIRNNTTYQKNYQSMLA